MLRRFFKSLHLAILFIRQTVVNNNKEKENTSRPTRIEPKTLAVATSIIKSMIAKKKLPTIPSERTGSMEHWVRHDVVACVSETAISVIKRKTRAIMITLCNNTTGIEITAVI